MSALLRKSLIFCLAFAAVASLFTSCSSKPVQQIESEGSKEEVDEINFGPIP